MKNKLGFFDLYYPSNISNLCKFLEGMKGVYVDLPGIIKEDNKNIKYENIEKIKFQDSIYFKVNKNTTIKLNMPNSNNEFYYGVINISDNDNLEFLFWLNIKDELKIEKIKMYLNNNLNISLKEGNSKEVFTAVWSKYEI